MSGSSRPKGSADAYPLTPLQEGILFESLAATASGTYVSQAVLTLEGADLDRLQRAWQQVVDRHPALRTAFAWQNVERPLQVVGREVRLALEREDWSEASPAEQETRLAAWLDEDRRRGFNLSKAPLLRLFAARTAPGTHRLVWTFHHILLDGWSVALVLGEVLAVEEALRAGRDPGLAPARPFRDYVDWISRQDLRRAEAFWRERLRGLGTPTLVAPRAPRPGGDGREVFGTRQRRLTAERTAALQAVARRCQVTLNTVVQGAWAIALSRWTGESEVLYGTTVAGRPPDLAGAEGVVGLFINTLPTRVAVPRGAAVAAWLRELQADQAAQRQFEHSPLVEVQGWSGVPRGTPLFDSLVAFESYPVSGLEAAAAGARGLRVVESRFLDNNSYPLALGVRPDREMLLRFVYDARRIEGEVALARLTHLERLLEGLSEAPEAPVGDLSMLGRDEERALVREWNETSRPYPRESTLGELFREVAERSPEAVAVSFGEESLRYRELEVRSNRLARHLKRLGAGPESRVGVAVARSLEMAVALLGVVKAGAAYVPLDPGYPAGRLSFMVADAGVEVLVTQSGLRGALAGFDGAVVLLDGDAEAIGRESGGAFDGGATPEDLAYVVYTSGSTGVPKGVAVPQRAVVRLVRGTDYVEIGPGDRVAQASNASFDAATFEVWGALLNGACLVGLTRETSLAPVDLARELRVRGVSVLFLTTALFNQVAKEAPGAFATLRALLFGGEAVDPRAVRSVLADGPPGRLLHVYGPTENTTFSTWHEVKAVEENAATVPIGRSIANSVAYVLDDAGARPVPVGVVGELYVGGDGLAREYLGKPSLTAERFRPDPFSGAPGSRLYRTGDRVRQGPGGAIEFLGRRDHQVKLRGFRIELGEIEAALLAEPGVAEAVALVREDHAGDPRLVAYVAGEAGPSELRARLRDRLPEYMVPSAVVRLDALPLTPNGKVDRRALPAPEDDRASLRSTLRTPVEEALAGIWERVLGVSGIGAEEDFFELGGHSLLATRVVSQVRKTFRVELPLRSLFEAPTVRALARRVEEARGVARALAPPLRPRERSAPVPLSFAQQRLYFLDQLGEGAAYHVPLVLRLRGELHAGALERGLGELVRRHESLRTRFVSEGGRAAQVVEPEVDWRLSREDLAGAGPPDEARAVAEARRRVREELGLSFDLGQAPLVRATLLRLGPHDHVLVLVLHHVVSDGWSIGVLARELGELYGAFRQGETPRLPDLPLQYADFAAWQREWLAGDVLEEQLAYWRRRLHGLGALPLPTDRPRMGEPSSAGACEVEAVPAEVVRGLRALGQREGATPFMVLLAAFQVLLARWTGQDDVAVGTPVAGRTSSELEGLVGFFVNSLVLRADLSGDPPFRELLARVKDAALEAYDRQDVPFERIVEDLSPERDLGRNPLFQVLFTLQGPDTGRWELPGLAVSPFGLEVEKTHLELELHLSERGGALHAAMTYRTDLFEPATVRRMLGQYRRLLEAVAADARRRLSDLPLLSPEEERRLLVDWNATATDRPRDRTLVDLFAEQAVLAPDAPAIECGSESLSFRELDRRTSRLARRLQELGVGPEVRVGVCLERTIELPVALLGALKAGGAYVPLDPAYPAERLLFMLEDSGVAVLLTDERLAGTLPAATKGTRRILVDRDREEIAGRSAEAVASPARPESLAYVIYTSGSTGRPKGVAIAHRSAVALLEWARERFAPEERAAVLASTSVCFDLSVFELFLPLCCGGAVHLVENALALAAPGAPRPTLVNTVPSAIAELLRQGKVPDSVRTIVLAGEPLSPRLVDGLYALGHVRRVYDCYGPSEDTTYSTWALRTPGGPATIGRPIADTQAYVLDRTGRPVPAGAVGELFLGGEGLARGYLDRPELTAERFVPDPFGPAPGGRLYRTGDLVRHRPDGTLEFLGRRDHQVKLRGFRIELGEVEHALRGHLRVREAVVLVREDRPSEKRLVAYVTARDGAVLGEADLRAHLRARLPAHMVPSAFVTLEALPLSPNGKVDRRALPAPEAGAEPGAAFEAARTPAEAALCRIWSDVLRVEAVGIRDNFFALGGDSILSLQVAARAREAGLHLSLRQLFQHQTVEELAAAAGEAREIDAEQGLVRGEAPLTPVQRWFFDLALEEPHHFNQAVLLEPRRELAALTLARALAALEAHHDALRARFRGRGAEGATGWAQSYADPGEPPFRRVDLRATGDADVRAEVAAIADETQGSLDLAAGPVWRAVLLDLGGGRGQRLLLVAHHLVVDGVSWRVLLEDLETAVAQVERGESVRLPPKTTSFRRWAERLHEHARDGAARSELPYWRGVVAPGASPLPVDHDAGTRRHTVDTVRAVTVLLDEDATRAVLQEVPAAYRTQAQDVLLAALVEAFHAWTGSDDLVLDLEGHGREDVLEDVDLTRTVGWFTTIYPVRLRREAGSAGDVLRSVKEQLRAVPGRGIGYGLLRHAAGEDLASPAEVAFNYLGRFDTAWGEGRLFALGAEGAGRTRSGRGRRPHLVEVNGLVSGGRLRVDLLYSEALHARATVEALAKAFEQAIGALVAQVRAGAWGVTPSDFPLAGLDEAGLQRVVAGRREVEDVYALASMQEGMLLHSLKAPESGLYVEQARFELEGPLEAGALRRAWETVAGRHAVLRTRLAWEGLARPVQVVERDVALPWAEEDWTGVPEAEREARFAELLRAEEALGLDPARAPLFRLRLVRLAEERHRLVWTFHHALLDGWCLPLVLGEVLRLARPGSAPEALPAVRPYREYVAWLAARDASAAERYWREGLRGFRAPTPLGVDRPRAGAEPGRDFGERAVLLEPLATARLAGLGRRHGLTLSTLVQGAWAALLGRYSGEREVLFGVTVSGRPASLPGVERMVGLFINTLPLRVPVDGASPALDWLKAIQERHLEQREWEWSPLWHVQKWSEVEGGRALFESLVVFENYPVDARALDLGGVRLKSLGAKETTNYPLVLVAGSAPSSLFLRVLYDRARFDDGAIERLLGHLQRLLEALGQTPEARVDDLPLLTEAEEATILGAWSEAAVDAPGPETVVELFAAHAARAGDALAVAGERESLTYSELDRRSNQWARRLQAMGVRPESRVGICVERSADMVVALLAVLKAGGAYVPLDPLYPASRLAFLVADAGMTVLLTEERLLPRLPETGARTVCLDRDRGLVSRESVEPVGGGARGDNLAYVIYTSGSTGQPKGVGIEHRSLANLVRWHVRAYGVGPDARATQVASPAFDASVWEIWPYLAAGASVHLPGEESRLAPGRLVAWLGERRITHAFLPTPLAEAALREPGAKSLGLRFLLTGGDVLHRVEGPLPFPLVNHYGPTENSVVSTCAAVVPGLAGDPPIGRPIANTRAYVLDGRMRPVPVGVAGELSVGGIGLARGYLGRPDLTAERFSPDPFGSEPGGRLYRTGDVVRLRPDGDIEFVGRRDDQVKLRGFRIEPGEVEKALREVPGVTDAAVLARDDRRGEKRLVAWVVGEAEGGDIRRELASRLPGHMVPSAFVRLDALPLGPNGKVDRRALPAPADARADAGADRALDRPRSDVEKAIAAVWCEVLRLDAVGTDENFFDLGGHSLSLLQVHGRLRERLGRRDLRVADLFEYPTVRALADRLAPPLSATGEAAPDPTGGRDAASDAIAVIGMAGRFPGAQDVDELWRNLRDGVLSISFFTDEELEAEGVPAAVRRDPRYVPARGVLAGADLFDAAFFGFNPREAELLDPQHRVFLETAWTALEAAGHDPGRHPGRIGVFAGTGFNSYLLQIVTRPDRLGPGGGVPAVIASDKDFLTTRVSYKLDLRGPSLDVQTACSTSLVAVHLACRSLQAGECDMALAGGVAIGVPLKAGYLYQEEGILSPDGHCRAFDKDARGTVSGSGVGIVVLKRLADARRDGDEVVAVIRGSAVNNDGAQKVGYTAPGVSGQADVIAQALRAADVGPETIGYVETHGTGTALGDPLEIRALGQAFAGRTEPCLIGSLKPNVGHLDAAAGVAGLIKAALALKHRQVPPAVNFAEPNPEIDFAGVPLRVATRLTEWPAGPGPRRAAVSSFGIGGTNAHVVLEEAPSAPPPVLPPRTAHLLVLSARTPAALDAATRGLAAHLERNPELELAHVAHTLQAGRRAFRHRRAAACRDAADARRVLAGLEPGRLLEGAAPPAAGGVAFLFPGQGAQHVRMGEGLYRTERVYRREVDRGAERLRGALGLDLREVLFPRDGGEEAAAERLAETAITQPALFVVEHALARLWMEAGVRPDALLGHSVGEYVAACLAGVFAFEDALLLVAARGRLLQSLDRGSMLAVTLPEPEVLPLLDGRLSLAATNGPSLSVVSGPAPAVAALESRLGARGVEARRLRTSHAFHSAMMDPAVGAFRDEVAGVERLSPRLPFVSNVTGTWIRDEEATDPAYWARHLRETVRFGDGLGALLETEGRVLLEVGPGQTLASLARRHPSGRGRVVVASSRAPGEARTDEDALLDARGRLWLAGVEADWTPLLEPGERRRVPLPTYPFERQRYWIDRAPSVTPAPPPSGRKADLGAWGYRPTWQALSPLPELAAAGDAPWLVFQDEAGLGARLAEGIARRGGRVVGVAAGEAFERTTPDGFTLRPGEAADYALLLDALEAEGALPRRIVHLWGVGAERRPLDGTLDRGFYSLLFLAQALGDRAESRTRLVTVVTSGMQQVSGEGLPSPEKATVLGPCRVIPREIPSIRCRSVDLRVPPGAGFRDHEVEALLAECDAPEADPVVALRGRERWGEAVASVPLGPEIPRPGLFREGGTFVVTGGFGGIGLEIASFLAESARARIVLVGRRGLPPREEWTAWLERHAEGEATSRAIRKVRELESRTEVLLLRADVGDRAQVEEALARAEARFGPVHGVVHAAGVAGGGVVARKTREAAERVLRPKVQGTLALLAALETRRPDFVVLCSSLASVLGIPGQVDYAAANAFEDAVARSRADASGPFVLSIGWDTWREAGMALETEVPAELRERREAWLATDAGIRSREGVQVFARALGQPLPHLLVSTEDLPARVARHLAIGAAPSPEAGSAGGRVTPANGRHPRPDLPVPYAAPRDEVEQVVADLFAELLGFDAVGVHDGFFDLGGHSLLATQVVNRLRETFPGVPLKLQGVFDAPTAAGLARALAAGEAIPGQVLEIARLVRTIEGLSASEVDRMLHAPVASEERAG